MLCDIEAWEAGQTNELVYWLKGVAGCGKSTIAQTFAERSAAHGNLGASFFCSRDYPDRRNLHLIFPTLAYDIAYSSAIFKTALVPIIRANPNVQYDALHIQLEKLLVRPFKQTGLSATIVVDALDECEDKEPVSEFLSALASYSYRYHSHSKILHYRETRGSYSVWIQTPIPENQGVATSRCRVGHRRLRHKIVC